MSESDDVVIPDLLQALEHSSEAVDRLSTVLRQFIDASQQRTPMADHVVSEYERQLGVMTTDVERLRSLVAAWWQTIGTDRRH